MLLPSLSSLFWTLPFAFNSDLIHVTNSKNFKLCSFNFVRTWYHLGNQIRRYEKLSSSEWHSLLSGKTKISIKVTLAEQSSLLNQRQIFRLKRHCVKNKWKMKWITHTRQCNTGIVSKFWKMVKECWYGREKNIIPAMSKLNFSKYKLYVYAEHCSVRKYIEQFEVD